MVGQEGFEPPTLCSQSRCASQTALLPDKRITEETILLCCPSCQHLNHDEPL